MFYPKRVRNKNILCIETYWNDSESVPVSNMTPILEFVTTARGTNYTYRPCHTIEELTYILKSPNSKKHSLIIFAFHGRPNEIYLGNKMEFSLGLNELAELMGTRFEGCGIHFSSCSVLNSNEQNIREFMNITEVSFVTGYGQGIDYIESALMDMAFIGAWFHYKKVGSLFKYIKSNYKDFIKLNNFLYFTR